MTRFTCTTIFLLLIFSTNFSLVAQDKSKDRSVNSRRYDIRLKDLDLITLEKELEMMTPEFSGLEYNLELMEKSLQKLELKLPNFELENNLEIMERSLQELEYELHLENRLLDETSIELSRIPNYMNFEGIYSGWTMKIESSRLFENLSNEEEMRLYVLRSLKFRDAVGAVNALENIIKNDPAPGLRYEAVHQLGRFIEDAGVVPLIIEVAKNDKNIVVKKKAIYLLGKSKSQEAVKALEDILAQ